MFVPADLTARMPLLQDMCLPPWGGRLAGQASTPAAGAELPDAHIAVPVQVAGFEPFFARVHELRSADLAVAATAALKFGAPSAVAAAIAAIITFDFSTSIPPLKSACRQENSNAHSLP